MGDLFVQWAPGERAGKNRSQGPASCDQKLLIARCIEHCCWIPENKVPEDALLSSVPLVNSTVKIAWDHDWSMCFRFLDSPLKLKKKRLPFSQRSTVVGRAN
eukprot:8359921-Pyramimonas_sp.AAC.1